MNGTRRPARWLRWLALALPIVVVACLVAFWIVTMPATVPASALPAYTPNVANGKIMFAAGGCAPCRAQQGPRQGRPDAARRRFGAKKPIRHVLRAQHLSRSEGRHRPLERGQFCHRALERHDAGRPSSVSGVSLSIVPAHEACGRARSL